MSDLNKPIKNENPLKIGICQLGELEERLKAFRLMNQTAVRKRYVLSREIVDTPSNVPVLKKSVEIDVPTVKLLRRYFPIDREMKIFQPDEGIVILSDMSDPNGIALSMDLVTQILNIDGGAYEGFIERVDSFGEFLQLLKKVLFPRLVIIGYLSPSRLEMEKINFVRSRHMDQYLRMIEITHSVYKKEPYFPRVRQIHLDPDDPYAWGRLIIEIIREYIRPYFSESIRSD